MTGVVLLNMGGPDCLEAVRPFLFNLFSDREIIRLGPSFLQRPIAWWIARKRAPKSRAAYARIGGRSPLAEITAAQARALEAALRDGAPSLDVRCLPGMRYWRPRTGESVGELKRLGATRVVALSLYPHYSRATSGSSIADFERSARELGMERLVVDAYPDDPLYVEALAETVRDGLSGLLGAGLEKGDAPPVDFALVYSAHSLPKSMIEAGDPYVEHLGRTIKAIEERTGVRGILSFQSRSGPVAWLEPGTDTLIRDLAGRGIRRILVLPLSFVSDHVETLYEIDMLYREMAASLGVDLRRTQALNTNPTFIRALSGLVREKTREAGWPG